MGEIEKNVILTLFKQNNLVLTSFKHKISFKHLLTPQKSCLNIT